MKSFKTPKGSELPILNLRGKDYLEVKYRLVWFREECPKHSLRTEFLVLQDKYAIAKATILDPDGFVLAVAHKREDQSHFPDFMEKAETSAIGRALALIGYGTQFCADELDEGERIVDAPVQKSQPAQVYNFNVRPQQPEPGDGVQYSDDELPWRFTFGKYRGRTLENVYSSPAPGFGPDGMASYIAWLEEDAKKKNKPLSDAATAVIRQIETFLGNIENGRTPA